jgi:hypothetical protein
MDEEMGVIYDRKNGYRVKKSKANPVTGRGGSHILQTIGSQVAVRLSVLRTALYFPETFFFCFWYSFMLQAE